jgi:hypothetical protein
VFKATNNAGNGYSRGEGVVIVNVRSRLETPAIYYGTEIDKVPGTGEFACRVGESQYIYIIDGGDSLNDNPTFVVSGLGDPIYVTSSDFGSDYALVPVDTRSAGHFNVTITRWATSKAVSVTERLRLAVYQYPTGTPATLDLLPGGNGVITINDEMPSGLGQYAFDDVGTDRYYNYTGTLPPTYPDLSQAVDGFVRSGKSLALLPVYQRSYASIRSQVLNNPLGVSISGSTVSISAPVNAYQLANGYNIIVKRLDTNEIVSFGSGSPYLQISVVR